MDVDELRTSLLQLSHDGQVVVASVVIPAHNESAVIDRCLTALLADAEPGEFEVVVVANGCTDGTADAARGAAVALNASQHVTVLERPDGGKIGALNAGDAVVTTYPRIYLDADVVLTTQAARATARLLASDAPEAPLAASPRPFPVTTGSSALVRWHYEAWMQLPVIRDRYVGSGVYAVSARGHQRLAPFPDVIADDLYARRIFARSERATAPAIFSLFPPTTVRNYLRRAVRAHAGNVALEQGSQVGRLPALAPEAAPRGARALVPLLRRPSMWHRLIAFASLTTVVRIMARSARRGAVDWNQDTSSRLNRSVREVAP